MRCQCCNVTLSTQESVRKFRDSGRYTDTCSRCLRDIDVPTVEGVNYQDDMFGDYSDEPFDDEELDE